MDRRFDPQRVAHVVRELDADVVALQELEFPAENTMLDIIAGECGFHSQAGVTFSRGDGAFGNGIVSRWPLRSVRHIDLTVSKREPRRAIDAIVDAPHAPFHFVATHFGLRASERVQQARRLVASLDANTPMPTILAGDINEWMSPRGALRLLHTRFAEATARATFPSPLPVFALDRILMTPTPARFTVRSHRSAAARAASDHLPLVADIEL